MAEIRAVASKRLELQQRAERAAEEAVLPTSRRQEDEGARPPPSNAGVEEQVSGLRYEDQEDKQETQTPPPKPKTPWVTVKLKRGRTLFAHKKALDERQATPSRYAALAEDDAEADADEGDTPEPPTTVETHPDVIDISSGSSQEEPKVRTLKDLSQAENRHLHIRKGAPPEIPAVAQLVALKQRERTALLEAVQPIQRKEQPVYEGTVKIPNKVNGFVDIERVLQIREVTTPATGNCIAMAAVQAIANHDLAAHDEILTKAVATLKR